MGEVEVAAPAPRTATPRAPGARPRVLAADDEKLVRDLVNRVLSTAGFEVGTYSSGEDLIVEASRNPPDVIIVDAVMPGGMNGFQVCRALRDNEPTKLTPIMMVTGLSEYSDRVYGIEAGADDYVCKPFRAEEVSARVRSLMARERVTDELFANDDVFHSMLRAIEDKAPHSERVARLSAALGELLGRAPEEIGLLCRAGLFHDVGKIAVPIEILNKPGALTPEEFEVVKCHPERGWQMCRRISVLRDALPAIRWHHEHLDGSGYPDRLQAAQIPFAARVIAVTSVFDALTGARAYLQAGPPERALEILRKEAEKGWWDGDIVRALAELIQTRGADAAPAGWTGLDRDAWTPKDPRPPSGRHVPARRPVTGRLPRLADVRPPTQSDSKRLAPGSGSRRGPPPGPGRPRSG